MGVVEVRSLPSVSPVAVRGPGLHESVVDLRGVGQVLRRRRMWIVIPALVAAVLAVLAAALLPVRYQASSRLIFDPRNVQVFQNDLRSETTSGEEAGTQAESQLQVITSASVLGKVVGRLDLARDPDFGAPRPSLLGEASRAVRGLFGGASAPADPAAVALRRLQADVTVRRTEKTYILEILVTTPDADGSARIANAIDEAFLDELVDSRSDAIRRSGQAVGSRLDELRSRLARSEAAVEAFRDSHDLVGADGKPVIEQQLTDINNQLTLARTRVAEQEARRDDLGRLTTRGDAIDAVTEANLSPVITALKAQLTNAQQAETEARLTYGARHPAMAAATVQVQAVRQHLAVEVARLARTAQSDLDRVRLSEKALVQRLDALKRQNADANDSLVRLRELEREATSDRAVYEAYLNRSKDLQERETVETVNARVLSPAVAPISTSNPSRLLLALGGLAAGALVGTGGGLVREQFDRTIRSRRQIEMETRAPIVARLSDGLGLDDSALWSLRDRLVLDGAAWPTRIVAVVGLGLKAGRGMLAHDLVRATESDGRGALLIDAEDERGELSNLLDAGNRRGLTDLVGAPLGAQRGDLLRLIGGARFLPVGQAASGIAGRSQELRILLDGLARDNKFIVIYGGAAGGTARLRTLAAVADDILLVVEGGRASVPELRSALDALGPEERRLRGIVLTGVVEDV